MSKQTRNNVKNTENKLVIDVGEGAGEANR